MWARRPPYGHDGRSINLNEVILRHGGEARARATSTPARGRWGSMRCRRSSRRSSFPARRHGVEPEPRRSELAELPADGSREHPTAGAVPGSERTRIAAGVRRTGRRAVDRRGGQYGRVAAQGAPPQERRPRASVDAHANVTARDRLICDASALARDSPPEAVPDWPAIASATSRARCEKETCDARLRSRVSLLCRSGPAAPPRLRCSRGSVVWGWGVQQLRPRYRRGRLDGRRLQWGRGLPLDPRRRNGRAGGSPRRALRQLRVGRLGRRLDGRGRRRW